MKRTGIDKTAYAAMILLLLFFMGVLYLKHSYARTQNYAALGAPSAVDRDLLLISNYQALKDSELGRELELLEYEAENLEEAVRRKIDSDQTPVPAAAARAETLRLTEHIVRERESLRSVARSYNVSPSALITVNNLTGATRGLTVGQSIRVPNVDGIMVTVRTGETLGHLAQRYRVPAARLVAFNRLGGVNVRAGQRLFVPGSNLQPPSATAPAPAREPLIVAGPGRGRGGYIHPCPGSTYVGGFGMRIHPVYGNRRFHNGIDLSAPAYTPIRAAKGGRVQYAGWISGYGKTVVIEHDDGLTTYYAHCISLTVNSGAYVTQGQLIGRVGQTGIATGPHLHFEIRSGAGAIDPAPYIGLSSSARAGVSPVRTPTVVQQGQPATDPAGAPTGEESNQTAPPAAAPSPPAYIDVEVIPTPTPSATPTVTGGGAQREGSARTAPGSSG